MRIVISKLVGKKVRWTSKGGLIIITNSNINSEYFNIKEKGKGDFNLTAGLQYMLEVYPPDETPEVFDKVVKAGVDRSRLSTAYV